MTGPQQIRRRLPRWSEFKPMFAAKHTETTRLERRLAKAHSIHDLRSAAIRRVPRAVFDYVEGGAGAEVTIERSLDSFRSAEFVPRVLRNVGSVQPAATIMGRSAAFPLVLAPTGLTRVVHHTGEIAVARAAASSGIPYTLSTMSTTSIEGVRTAAPDGEHWFQLYMWRDREASKALIDRAAASGYSTLMLTVDVPVAGERLRDLRNGFTVPLSLSARTLADMARHPSWSINMLTTEPLTFASMSSSPDSIAGTISKMFDPAVTFEDLAWVRRRWKGKLILKGIQTQEDALQAADAGVDGIVLSNHGGRQLDRGCVPLEILPKIRAAVGERMAILLDGGIRDGADIAAAVGLGADACLVGRAYLYGLMAGGEAGVNRAVDLLRSQFVRTMQLLGATSPAELRHGMVHLR